MNKVLIVFFCPSYADERNDQWFCAPADARFQSQLTNVGLYKYKVVPLFRNYIEQPKRRTIIEISKGKVKFKSNEFDLACDKLIETIEEKQPNLILAIGEEVMYALTGKTKIMLRRGSVYPLHLDRLYKVMPILSPVITEKMPELGFVTIKDLEKAKKRCETPDYEPDRNNYIIRPNYIQAVTYLQKAKQHNLVAFDIEVTYGEVSCISFAYKQNEAISIAFVEGNRNLFTVEEETKIWRHIAEILESKRIKKLGQNISFDISFLLRKLGIHTTNVDDTMIAQAICYFQLKKGLDMITSLYSDEPYYKDEGKEWRNIKDWKQFWIYNAKDACILMTVFPKLLHELQKTNNVNTYQWQKRLVEPLVYMGSKGIRMDVEGMKKLKKREERKLERYTKLFNKVCGKEINPRSPAQLKEFFYGKVEDGGLGIKPYRNRTTGSISTDEETMKRISRQGYIHAKILLKIRQTSKLVSTYLSIKLSEDRLKCAYNPVGTGYGRLSSSKNIFGEGTNQQNQPYIMKKFMLADEGFALYNFDLAKADNTVVAYLANQEEMIYCLENKIDMHNVTAGLIFNKPPEKVSNVKGSCSLGDGKHTERDWGKRANHGLNYGYGYKAFALKYEMPENEARHIVDKYHSVYPNVRNIFHATVKNSVMRTRSLKNLMGRTAIYLGRLDYKTFNEAYSFIPQSTVADIVNRKGLIYIWENRNEHLQDVCLINQVHDSLGFQIPLSRDWEYHARCLIDIRNHMQPKLSPPYGKQFHIPVEGEIGTSFHNIKDIDFSLNVPELAKDLKEKWEILNGTKEKSS